MPMRLSPKLREHHLIVARLGLMLMDMSSLSLLGGARMRGSIADYIVLRWAVYIGQAEKKPMTAAKLAEFAGIPRPTVVRKIKRLHELGIVEINGDGTIRCNPDLLVSPPSIGGVKAAAKQIKSAAEKLGRLGEIDDCGQ